MQGFHQEWAVMRRHWREAIRTGKTLSAGHYRKRDAHDCGRARCGICHREKRFGHRPTRQELLSSLRMCEELSE